MEMKLSPLTGIEVECTRYPLESVSYYEDPICGPYAIGDNSRFKSVNTEDMRKIASVLATRALRYGGSVIRLTDDQSGVHEKWELVPIDSVLAQYPKDVVSIFDEALVNLSKLIKYPSDRIAIDKRAQWLIYAHDHDSADYMVRQLKEAGHVADSGGITTESGMVNSVTIESKGWERLRELRDDSSQSNQVFVAMWFDDEVQGLFDEAIVPAITGAGFSPFRIDLKEHNNKICDEIIAEIRRSRFVVADFTGNRGGVYYEAGYAHGLGKQVIWTVREDHLKDVHFDTRQYNHITYATTEELRERLFNRIRATQG